MEEYIYYGDLGRAYLYLGKDDKVVDIIEKGMMNQAKTFASAIKEPWPLRLSI